MFSVIKIFYLWFLEYVPTRWHYKIPFCVLYTFLWDDIEARGRRRLLTPPPLTKLPWPTGHQPINTPDAKRNCYDVDDGYT